MTSPDAQARRKTSLATKPSDLHENSRRETHAAPQPSCREAATCYMQCVTTLEDEDVRAKLKGSRSAHHRGNAHAQLSRRSRRPASRCRWYPPRGGAPRAPPPRTAASAARRPPRHLDWVAANPTRVSDGAGVPWLFTPSRPSVEQNRDRGVQNLCCTRGTDEQMTWPTHARHAAGRQHGEPTQRTF